MNSKIRSSSDVPPALDDPHDLVTADAAAHAAPPAPGTPAAPTVSAPVPRFLKSRFASEGFRNGCARGRRPLGTVDACGGTGALPPCEPPILGGFVGVGMVLEKMGPPGPGPPGLLEGVVGGAFGAGVPPPQPGRGPPPEPAGGAPPH